MNCSDCRPLVEDYLNGSLSEPDEEIFENHLDSCSDCAQELEGMRRLDEALYTGPLKMPSVDFTQRTLARLRREKVPTRDDALLLQILAYAASFGALLFGVSEWSAQAKWVSFFRSVTEIFTEIVPKKLLLSLDDWVLTFSTSSSMVSLEAGALCILFILTWLLCLSFSD